MTNDQTRPSFHRRGLPLLVACCMSLPVGGCVTRALTIKTDPPGALVYVNDQLKGTSPVTYDFLWYGWHRVTLRKEGYQRLDDQKLLHSPVYLWIPFDLVLELMPFRIRDARTLAYALIPSPVIPTPVPPAIEPSTKPASPTVQPPVTPQVNEQVHPDAVGEVVSPSTTTPPTPPASSMTITPPPAEPPTAEPTTEQTNGTR